ncbi:MAG: hypothetical protein Ct9H300mP27_09570 [Chloroflexota bacterium]|nr:MAG: hypothetical protein Ct9H300mP27_09570 [Chloroflexota bacterium]
MRFGHFFYPMKFDDSKDADEIQNCLEEAELVENLQMERFGSPNIIYGRMRIW